MKKLKIIIGILIIIIVIIIATIIFINRNGSNIDDAEVHNHASEQEETTDILQNNIEFFTVASCVSQYLDTLNENNSIYYGYSDNGEYEQIDSPYDSVIELLSSNYIAQNDITQENIQDKVQLLKEKYIFVPLKMRVIQNEKIDKYAVYGIVQNSNNEYIEDIYIFVNLDPSNSTFSVEPIDQEYTSIEEINYENNEDSIEPNDFNSYVEVTVNNEYIVKKYIEIYKQLALARQDIAYEFLDEEYRNKRFGTLEAYQEYINNNRQEIQSIQVTQYLVNSYDEYKEYVCRDKNDSYYIFKENSIMDFTLQLDTYTIPTENFIKEYDEGDDQDKVLLNIDKWVKMLNNRDYNAAYNVLDETFRNNNFGSEENFENTMRERLPLHYEVQYNEYTEENGTHVTTITLSDINGESEETSQMSIIMQLKEDRNFVMSFSFN